MSTKNASFLDQVFETQENFEDNVEYKDEELLDGPELSIIEFTESAKGLNLELRPAQKVILKLLYGVSLSNIIPEEPEDTPAIESKRLNIRHPISGIEVGPLSELEYLEFLKSEGRTNAIEGREYTTLILNIGRRGGKSTLSAIISTYEIYKLLRKRCPQRHYKIRENAVIRVIVVGTDKTQSEALFNDISSFASSSPYLRKYLADDIKSEVSFFTPHDKQRAKRSGSRIKPTLQVRPVSCNASTVRGPNTIDGIMDECAHMMDSSKRASASSVYEALEPSVSTFKDGKMILISTPNGPQGFFYDIYSLAEEEGGTSDMLAVKAPTWEINPGRVSDSKFRNKWKLDRNSFSQEYGADFTSTSRDYIEDPDMFFRNFYPIEGEEDKRCLLDPREPISKGHQGVRYYFAADLGFKQDSTCFAVGHAEESNEEYEKRIVIDYVAEYEPGPDHEWTNEQGVISFEKMAKETIDLIEDFSVVKGAYDQHHGTAYTEQLVNHNITNFVELAASDKIHNEAFQIFRRMYQEERLVIPGFDWIINNFLNLEMKKSGIGDKEKIQVKARKGKHDDVADAIVRVVYLIYKEVFLKERIGSKPVKTKSSGQYKVITDLRHNRNVIGRGRSKNVEGLINKHSGGKSARQSMMRRRF